MNTDWEMVTHPEHGPGQVIRQFHDPTLPGLVLVEFPGGQSLANANTNKPFRVFQPWVMACQLGELKVVGDRSRPAEGLGGRNARVNLADSRRQWG